MLTQNGFTYRNLAANATTLIRTGPGILHSITINTVGASANVCTVYDGLSAAGTPIATMSTVAAAPLTLNYDVQFNVGLTIVIATGTAANITVAWLPLASNQS